MYSNPNQPNTKNLRRRLKVLVAAALFSLAVPYASAQNERLILPTRDVSLEQSLDEIQRQTYYKVAFDGEKLNLAKKITVSGSQLTVRDLLAQVLRGTGYTYQVKGSQIVLTPQAKEQNATDDAAADQKPLYSAMDASSFDNSQVKEVVDPDADSTTLRKKAEHSNVGYWVSENGERESLELVMLHFRVGRSLLEKDFMGNIKSLEIINRTFSDTSLVEKMDYVTITSASSPEGNTTANEKLAKDRALAVKGYIMWKHPHLDRSKIYTYSVGEDWSGLRKMVEDDKYVPARDEVIEVLNKPISNDQRKAMLKNIDGGKAYAYIAKNMLPYLRGAAACMIYFKGDGQDADTVEVEPIPVIQEVVRVDTVLVEKPVPVVETVEVDKPHYYAVKTNLLYDAALLPNVAFEFSLGKRWSMEVEGMWSWWNTRTTHKFCHRIQMGSIEGRKWLGNPAKTPLTGHYLGVYAMGGSFDLRYNTTKGYQSDFGYSAGVSYGYSKPLRKRLNLELGLAVGYAGGEYKKYTYDSKHDRFPWISTHDLSYFGLTKAKVSLVWLIGSGINEGK